MRIFTLLLSLLIITPSPSKAQEITAQPICFTIRNSSNHRVYGEVATDKITDSSGQVIHHTGSFRLEAAGTRHPKKGYLLDSTEFCSSGPFFPGRQLDFTIRTLFPIFSCKISVELGEVVIQSKKYKKDGIEITKTWATCL